MSSLLQQLTGPPDSVHGAMRVLSDFVSVDMSEDQLLPLARDLMPHLLGILGSPAVHSPATRARAVLIFRQCVMTLFTVKDEHPAAVKSAVGDILPQWVSAFKQLLARAANEDLSESNWDAIAVRVAIYQVGSSCKRSRQGPEADRHAHRRWASSSTRSRLRSTRSLLSSHCRCKT